MGLLKGLTRLLSDPVTPIPQRVRRGAWLYKTTGGAPEAVREHYERILAAWERHMTRPGEARGIRLWGEAGLPVHLESQHLLLVGAPGSGKTTILWQLIQQVVRRGDRAIIVDSKGVYAQGLLPLGPARVGLIAAWDRRSVSWPLGVDMVDLIDAHETAQVLVPENPRVHEPFWDNSARAVIEGGLLALQTAGQPWSWRELYAFLSDGGKEGVRKRLTRAGVRGAAPVSLEGDGNAPHSVFSTLSTHLHPLHWLARAWPDPTGGLSLRRWVAGTSGPPILILGGLPQYQRLATTTARLALEVVARAILSLPDAPTRRFWLFLDEFATLGRLDAVLRALLEGRSKGLRGVVAIQDLGRLEHIWSRELAKTLSNTFATLIALRCGDAATAAWLSETLGEGELEDWHATESTTAGGWGHQDTTTTAWHREVRIQPAVLPAQLMQRATLEGFLRVPSWPIVLLKWPLTPIPQRAPLVERAAWVQPVTARLAGAPEPPEAAPPPDRADEDRAEGWEIGR